MDLANLSPEDLLALKAQLDGLTNTDGRSPFRPRQLHDLRLLPTKDDPRPTFYFSAEAPRNQAAMQPSPFAQLLWHPETHEEITVHSRKELDAKVADGYLLTAPGDLPVADPLDALRAALESMPEEDRKLLMADQKQQRMASLTNQLASLSPEELERVLGQTGKPGKKKASAA